MEDVRRQVPRPRANQRTAARGLTWEDDDRPAERPPRTDVRRRRRPQDRLRSLLHALETISDDLSVDAVLRNVVEAARDLTGARYAALAVLTDDGNGVAQLVQSGFESAASARAAPLPGLGDAASRSGASHGSFLHQPIRLGPDDVYGDLYLVDAPGGSFDAADEELIEALAGAAGRALRNAHRFDEAELQQRWLAAAADITQQLVASGGDADSLPHIAATALVLARADVVTLGLVVEEAAEIAIETAVGTGAAALTGQRYPLDDVVAGLVFEAGEPMVFTGGALPGGRTSTAARALDAGPMLVVPLRSGPHRRAVLTLARRRGRPGFSRTETDMAAFFADHAAVALELAEARAAERRLSLFEDRERIARDLHDQVISELFSLGIGMAGAGHLGRPVDGEQLLRWSDQVDRAIRRIRTTIFAIRHPGDAEVQGIRHRLLNLCRDLTPALGTPPGVVFSGALDSTPPDLWDDLESVVREALTNVAKHARASRVDVEVRAQAHRLSVVVADDGIGIGDPTRSSGVANMRWRAEHHGGSFTVTPGARGGTTLTWWVPVQ